jgi:hypothetical protein
MPNEERHLPLPGSERPRPHGSRLIGPLDDARPVTITVLVRSRQHREPIPGLEYWQKIPPRERHFLTVEQYIEKYGASDRDLDELTEFVRRHHLNVVERHVGRRSLVVQGSAAHMNATFAIRLNEYETPLPKLPRRTRTGPAADPPTVMHLHHGYDGPVHLPAELIDIVTAVVGLDNRTIGAPAGTGDPTNSTLLSVPAIAGIYDFPNPGATDQTIGVIAPQNLPGIGSSYLPSDINNLYFPSLQAGFQTAPASITDINLTVGGNIFSNNTALVQGITASTNLNAFPFNFIIEVTQDISTSATIAQGATVNVYFTQNSEQGWVTFLGRVLIPAGEKQPTVVTCSFFISQKDDAGAIGSASSSGSMAAVMTNLFQQLAVLGISVFIALGDWGADDGVIDGHSHVSFPGSDPWITSCGGTVVGNVGVGSPPPFAEFAWSDAFSNSGFGSNNSDFGATGGGASANFPVPLYQTAAGITQVTDSNGNVLVGRFLPDVAGMVGYDGFFVNGLGYSFVGTSCVAPLYAGLLATVRSSLGFAIGVLNPTLYQLGDLLFHDVTQGNNDSGDTPDSPFFTSGISWDACTGWGSFNGRRLQAGLSGRAMLVTATASAGDFGNTCLGSFIDLLLTINNSGFGPLVVSNITSSLLDFTAPSVISYPLVVEAGDSIDLVVRFRPTISGLQVATFTIFSNDLGGPHSITVTGDAPNPRLVLMTPDSGNFGKVCVGSLVDESLIFNNSGKCPLSIRAITSSSLEFLLPQVSSYPVRIGPGDCLPVPIRFQPTSFGPKTAVISVVSDDPASPSSIAVSGDVPAGKIAVTGSAYFGGICACTCAERVIAICNVGECQLLVSSVKFKRKSRHWKLINNAFPTTLHPGSCLNLVIRYKATERHPRSQDLIIVSDDPLTPIKEVEVIAYTTWEPCDCRKCCEDCRKGDCDKRHRDHCCKPSHHNCCDDDDDHREDEEDDH